MPQTIIATVGTSLLTNHDKDLPPEKRRPWLGQPQIGDLSRAVAWLGDTEPELASAETNTLWRLDLRPDDIVHLLHSDTPEGLECAETLETFLRDGWGQRHVRLHRLPGIHYEPDGEGSALERLAFLLRTLIGASEESRVTLAATGGFKAEVMVMAIAGQENGVPVCYVHERFRTLVYLPWLAAAAGSRPARTPVEAPASGTPRDEVFVLGKDSHHRPKALPRLEQMLCALPWVDRVRFAEAAFRAPRNGVKAAPRGTDDGRHVYWLHWEDSGGRMALAIETTGHSPAHGLQMAGELRERLGRLL
ncbi:MAG: putative CRISPR-associated protein [Candidatus Sericytochromatia bacterium]|nr:putative CRISPR-associated protein [Candidatus Tanganyikabacteria bacterium]